MLVADAINRAADHIEAHPDQYDFSQGMVLDDGDKGIPACMLARIGQVAGVGRGVSCEMVAVGILGYSAEQFYARILESAGAPADYKAALYNAATVAPALRKVAAKYHGIPQEVREIFAIPVMQSPRVPPRSWTVVFADA